MYNSISTYYSLIEVNIYTNSNENKVKIKQMSIQTRLAMDKSQANKNSIRDLIHTQLKNDFWKK